MTASRQDHGPHTAQIGRRDRSKDYNSMHENGPSREASPKRPLNF
jgi:hypothetical protein